MYDPGVIGTGIPRNSPVTESLSPSRSASAAAAGGGGPVVLTAGSFDGRVPPSSAAGGGGVNFAGQSVHGVLDLSGLERVRGTMTKGMSAFVATAWDHVAPRVDEESEARQRKSHGRNRGAAALKERSSPSRERLDLRRDLSAEGGERAEIQMRFAASVMPPGRRHIQPLPEILEGVGAGFHPSLAARSSPHRGIAADAGGGYLSTAAQHQHQHAFSRHDEASFFSSTDLDVSQVNDAALSCSTLSTTTAPKQRQSHQQHQHQQRSQTRAGSAAAQHHAAGPSPAPKTPQPHAQDSARRGASGGAGAANRLYSQRTLRDSLNELQQPHRSVSRGGGANSSRRRAASGGGGGGVSGRASRVTCCPEDMARAGHLAGGIVIGSCERQAMERYIQSQRELELEKEARATDKWKHELELVKLLNKTQELEAQVEKLTEAAKDPRALREAQLLRGEFEARWNKAQARVEELEAAKVQWEAAAEETKLALLKKDHEIEGLRAAVKRMEATDADHEDVLAIARKKWFDEKSAKEKAEAQVEELKKHVSRLDYKCKSYRGAIRGLEAQLVVKTRRDNLVGNPSGRSGNNVRSQSPADQAPFAGTPVGAGRSVAAAVRDGSGPLQIADIDKAVNTLMSIYSTPRGSDGGAAGGGAMSRASSRAISPRL